MVYENPEQVMLYLSYRCLTKFYSPRYTTQIIFYENYSARFLCNVCSVTYGYAYEEKLLVFVGSFDSMLRNYLKRISVWNFNFALLAAFTIAPVNGCSESFSEIAATSRPHLPCSLQSLLLRLTLCQCASLIKDDFCQFSGVDKMKKARSQAGIPTIWKVIIATAKPNIAMRRRAATLTTLASARVTRCFIAFNSCSDCS